ncbi:MAG: sigma-54-dependent Fis family transcriptional regulator [Deltaproteobacteria bacterium]|nr:sigma-54-dependent Fis family transcriptional regulator [Deltaproteobacteria bacterium]
MPEPRALRVLLVDDDETFRRVFGGALAEDGFAVETASDGVDALETMQRRAFDLALVDLRMARMDGLGLLGELQRRHPQTVPIVLTGFGAVPTTVEAMRRGAFDVVCKSSPVEDVVKALRNAAERRLRTREGTGLEDSVFEHDSFFGIVGRSAAMRDVFRTIERMQAFDRPVLICGESGTGKELVARALHAGGRRAKRPLITVNCASLRENFVENELFGHVRGAFTGAVATKPGLFALADGGSLLIDEVGELPAGAQAALLRVLETGRYRPIGGQDEVCVDVRVIAATHRDLQRMAEEERFRADLYYRLCVCKVELPPLRKRPEDLPLLLNHFLDASATARAVGARVGPGVLGALLAHDWPGNVRELFNTLERAAILADDGVLGVSHLALDTRASESTPPPRSPLPARAEAPELPSPEGGDPTLEELERSYVRDLLRRTGGNVAEVARVLGVDPTTIRRKLRRWGDRI